MPENTNVAPNIAGLSTLLVLQDEVKKLKNHIEFGYFVTNETHRLLPYHTAYLWKKSDIVKLNLIAQSGVAEIDMQAPINQWLQEVIGQILDANLEKKIHSFSFEKSSTEEIIKGIINEELINNWPSELPAHILWSPFFNEMHEISGGLILFRESRFSESEIKMFQWLFNNYQYSWKMLEKHEYSPFKRLFQNKPHKNIIAAIVLIVAFFPIHLSVIASATVESKNPALINAPVPGVIGKFLVKPGDVVKKGQILLVLDDKDLSNSVEVSEKKVLLAEAKLRSTISESLIKQASKAEIPVLREEIKVNQAELDYTKSLLDKTTIISPIDGIVVFDSKEEWIGQPVQTGENILYVADPNDIQLKISLPVSDLIDIDNGSEGKFYLYGKLSEIPVVISSQTYNAKMMPNKVLAYELIAQFSNSSESLRLGSQGSVRLYGRYVPVIYYLLRRPVQAFRQTFGI